MSAAEARRRIGVRELREWGLFEEGFGPLTVQERIDAMSQQIAYVVHASLGGKEPPERFERRWVSREPLDDDGVVTWLRALARRGE